MAGRIQGADLDFNSAARILNLLDPSAAQEPATKAYVDANIEGQAWKDSVRAASTSNLDLSTPGASIDGVSLSNGDRVLVKDQTAPAENGIYIWNGASTVMTRALDASTGAELEAAIVTVEEGTANAGTTWRQSEVDIVIDTDDVTWNTFGVSVPDASETVKGKIEIATQAETDTGTDDVRAITPLKLKNSKWAAIAYQANIGDGSATQYDITHSFGTRDVQVEVYRNSGNYDSIDALISRPSTNAVRLNFASPPSSNQFRVVITKATNA